jgi:lysyl-tRNA synthetase class 2
MKTTPKTILALTCAVTTSAFVIHHPPQRITTTTTVNTRLLDTPIVSPFDDTTTATTDGEDGTTSDLEDTGPLELTWDNVEMVLDGMRPYLIQDGGNVIISEIDGPVVRLELQVSTVPTID